MSFEGMDLDEVPHLAGRIDTQAARIEGVVTMVDTTVRALASLWTGDGLGQFSQSWYGSHRATASAASAALREASRQLQIELVDQTAVSGTLDGVTGKGGPGLPSSHLPGGPGSKTPGGPGSPDTPDPMESWTRWYDDNVGGPWEDTTGPLDQATAIAKFGSLAGFLLANPNALRSWDAFKSGTAAWDVFGTGPLKDTARFLEGENWAELARSSRYFQGAAPYLENGAVFMKGLGLVGAGVTFAGGVNHLASGIMHHNTAEAVEGGVDMLEGGLMAGAVLAPPPADLVCGAAVVGVEIYKHADDIGHAAESVAKGASHVVSGIGHALSHVF